MMKVIIDRFEGVYAVCETENKEYINILKSELPKGIKEGDVVCCIDNEWHVDEAITQERKEKIKNKLNSLFAD